MHSWRILLSFGDSLLGFFLQDRRILGLFSFGGSLLGFFLEDEQLHTTPSTS